MVFDVGFLGTRSPFFIDFITSFFILLPFFLLYSILHAKNGYYKKHINLQKILFVLTIIFSVTFEVLIRMDKDLFLFTHEVIFSSQYLIIYFYIHIFVATIALAVWCYLIIISHISYKKDALIKRHVVLGHFVFYSIALTSVMGTVMYMLIFLVQ